MGGLPFVVGSKGELRDLASYHYGTLRGTLQQTYPLHLKALGTGQAQESELQFVVELLQ